MRFDLILVRFIRSYIYINNYNYLIFQFETNRHLNFINTLKSLNLFLNVLSWKNHHHRCLFLRNLIIIIII